MPKRFVLTEGAKRPKFGHKQGLGKNEIRSTIVGIRMHQRTATLIFLFFALFYGLTHAFREAVQMPDEEYVLHVTSALVSGGSLALPESMPKYAGVSRVGNDGKTYSVYQIGQSLIYAPFYWVIRTGLTFADPYRADRFEGDRGEYDTMIERKTRRFLGVCPTLFAAASCAILAMFLLRLGFSQSGTILTTLIYGLGTMIWPYSKALLTESCQNALLLGSIYALFVQRQEGRLRPRLMLLAGAAFGVLLSIRAIYIVLAPLLAIYWFYRNRERRFIAPIILFGLPMLVGLLPQLMYDRLRFGGLLATGYGSAGFTTPIFVGLYGYLFSSGKSIFLYAPVTLLFFFGARTFFHRAKEEALLIFAILTLVPLKYAGWWVWSGDPAWGPRYLLVLMPLLMLPAAEVLERVIREGNLWKKGLIGILFGISFFVQLLAVSVHHLYYLNHVRHVVPPRLSTRDPNIETEFNPEFSPVLGQWWMVRSLLSGAKAPPPWSGLGVPQVQKEVPLKASWDFWVVELFRGGFQWAQIKLLLAAVALVIALSIVGQELLVSMVSPTKKSKD